MKILVTGAAGFIGFHLVRELLQKGNTVVGLDNINDYYDPQLKFDRLKELGFNQHEVEKWNNKIVNGEVSFIRLNLEDGSGLKDLFETENFDIVVNLAAQAGVRYSIENPRAYIDSNMIGFYNILECARAHPVKHLLFASSSSVYGKNKKVPFSEEDHVDHPISLYAATKKSNELMAHTYSHLFNIPVTGLRFFTVYGPWGRPDMAYWLFTEAISNDRPIKVFNHGNMERDFTYIDDVVNGIVKLLDHAPNNKHAAPYSIMNIGNNQPEKLEHFISIIEKELGRKAQKEYLDMQDGDVERTYADINKLAQLTGFSPSTSLEEGLKNFVLWFKEYKS